MKSSEIVPPKTTPVAEPETGRLRRVVETIKEPPLPCTVTTSEKSISLLNGGGSLGVLINIKGAGDLREIIAASSSPNDVEAMAQPPIDDDFSRGVFFIVKSISRKTGVFIVTFEMPCGKKEMTVKVR